MKKINFIFGAVIVLVILATVVFIARPSANPAANDVSVAANSGELTTEEASFSFGDISMMAGKVHHSYKIYNNSAEPVMISKIYTSCMCTVAILKKDGQDFGPFGMPGHGAIPTINVQLKPKEQADVYVTFDPAAHGPAGVGRIERAVYLETLGKSSGAPFELKFNAMVTP